MVLSTIHLLRTIPHPGFEQQVGSAGVLTRAQRERAPINVVHRRVLV